MMHYRNIIHNTPEWYALRAGKIGASAFNDACMSKSTSGFKNLVERIVEERMTGKPVQQSFSNYYMQRGHEMEPHADNRYQALNFQVTRAAGFFELDEWVGVSPDRLVGDDGLLEIKCPAFNTMREYLKRGKLPSVYVKQVQGQLWVTGRKWCDFFAWHPELPALQIRVEPDQAIIDEIIAGVERVKTAVKSELNEKY